MIEWADNPFLDPHEVALLTASMSQEDIDARRYGRFNNAEGLVYSEFDQNVHVIEPFSIPYDWQAEIAIDPGLNNPCAVLFCCVDYDGVVYIVAEHYESKRDIDYHAESIFELADSWNNVKQVDRDFETFQ